MVDSIPESTIFLKGEFIMDKMTHAQRVDSNRLASEYFDSLLLKYRYIDGVEPSTQFTLFGETFQTPILSGPLGRPFKIHPSGSAGYAQGVADAGSLSLNGWIDDELFESILASGIRASRGIKPFADHDLIYKTIEHDAKCGAFAFTMDIDHVFDENGKYASGGFGVLGPQTIADLRGYATATSLPFIVKGILNPIDAEKCVEAGASAIIVSNHNNRFPSAVPPLAILPEIKRAVGNAIPVLLDGCIESGVEAFKALALGADGVLVVRALMAEFKNGPQAVTDKLNAMRDELAGCMANTCSIDLSHISEDCIFHKNW
jgi:hypothetical protein